MTATLSKSGSSEKSSIACDAIGDSLQGRHVGPKALGHHSKVAVLKKSARKAKSVACNHHHARLQWPEVLLGAAELVVRPSV
jgi:hypothetical protein